MKMSGMSANYFARKTAKIISKSLVHFQNFISVKSIFLCPLCCCSLVEVCWAGVRSQLQASLRQLTRADVSSGWENTAITLASLWLLAKQSLLSCQTSTTWVFALDQGYLISGPRS